MTTKGLFMITKKNSRRIQINFPFQLDSNGMRKLLKHISENVPNEEIRPKGSFEGDRRTLSNRCSLADGIVFSEFTITRTPQLGASFSVSRDYSANDPAYIAIRFKHSPVSFERYSRPVIDLVDEVRAATEQYFSER